MASSIVLAGCAVPAQGPPRALEAPAPAASPPAIAPAAPAPPPAQGTLRIHYVDVGQGDGVVWKLPDGSFVVYDCGDAAPSAAQNPMVARLRALGLPAGGTIHALVASHGHLDHVGGCEEVLQEYRVLHLYEAWYDGADRPASYARFREQVKAEGGVVHVLEATPAIEGEAPFRAGDEVNLTAGARAAGVRAEVLWPPAFQGRGWGDIARSSLVVRLSFGAADFCFQGDIETAEEAALASNGTPGDCEVYLMGHHGSRYASSAAWLAKLRPRYAVASFGPNSHGHPTAEALCRVQEAGAAVYATHRLGSIAVSTDGTALAVEPSTPETKDYCQPGADYWAA